MVGVPQVQHRLRVDVHVRQMGNEVISQQVPHEYPIINYSLQIEFKRYFGLQKQHRALKGVEIPHSLVTLVENSS